MSVCCVRIEEHSSRTEAGDVFICLCLCSSFLTLSPGGATLLSEDTAQVTQTLLHCYQKCLANHSPLKQLPEILE